jgi:hypothetical protein
MLLCPVTARAFKKPSLILRKSTLRCVRNTRESGMEPLSLLSTIWSTYIVCRCCRFSSYEELRIVY